jgi:hypothetical protein
MAHTSPASKIRPSATRPAELRGFPGEAGRGGVLFEFDSLEDIGFDWLQRHAARYNFNG